jgi:poly(A) polymerase
VLVCPKVLSVPSARIDPTLQRLLARAAEVLPDAHLVGGALRDALSGRLPADLDLLTTLDAHKGAEALAAARGGSVFTLDEGRRQYRVVLRDLPETDVGDVDISQIDELEADLRRRDFTVDAMAAPIERDGSFGALIDPTGGLADLESGRLRMVARRNLEDDALRLMRAVRLATELQLTVEETTSETIRELAPRLAESAAERQRDELVRILATSRSAWGLRLLDALALLEQLVPELMTAKGVEQPANYHYWDVFEHSIQAVQALDEMLSEASDSSRPWLGSSFREGLESFDIGGYLGARAGGHSRLVLLKLAALLHDNAKPETKSDEENGRVRFFGHSEAGAEKARRICRRLRFGSRETGFVSKLVEEHLRPAQLSNEGLPTRRALYRFFRDLGDAAPACLVLSLADAAAAAGPKLQQERWRGHVAYAAHVLDHGPRPSDISSKPPRLIKGDELMAALALEPGPELGRLLSLIDEAYAVGDISTSEEAIELARRTPPPAPSPNSGRGSDKRPPASENYRRWRTSTSSWAELGPRAREMRTAPTPAEDKLWQHLRRNQVAGLRFRRQHAIGRFIVDFYCPAAKLIIEVDGPVHAEQTESDREREAVLEDHGFSVLRLGNDEVLYQIHEVLARIRESMSGVSKTGFANSTSAPTKGSSAGGSSASSLVRGAKRASPQSIASDKPLRLQTPRTPSPNSGRVRGRGRHERR